jgi:hypothetical protein
VPDSGDSIGIRIPGDDVEAVRELAAADPSVRTGRKRGDARPSYGNAGDTI